METDLILIGLGFAAGVLAMGFAYVAGWLDKVRAIVKALDGPPPAPPPPK